MHYKFIYLSPTLYHSIIFILDKSPPLKAFGPPREKTAFVYTAVGGKNMLQQLNQASQ
jgi:hypothetical protein